MSATHTDHPLAALRGSSLLGFMAALGTLHTLSGRPEYAACRMRWVPSGGSFSPVLRVPSGVSGDELLAHLHESLASAAGHQVFTFDKDLKVSGRNFRRLSGSVAEDFLNHKDAFGAAVAAALGCDSVINDEGQIEDTAFRTMSGAGHQHFLEFMNVLAHQTTVEHLREALFGPWRYRDPSPIMRWDDADDRRYALRWDEPSKDPVRTVRGANRLAVAALPLFPAMPVAGGALGTTGFKGGKSNDTFVTWPVWEGWLTLDAVRSLLSLRALQMDEPPVGRLAPVGVVAVFRSQRITLGKYRNFTPARAM